MLAKFSVSNFKNFKEPIEFTLDQPGKFKYNSECISDGIVGKAILYGKNATGKSNLGHGAGILGHSMTEMKAAGA